MQQQSPNLHNVDAERALLGSIMVDPAAIHEVERIEPGHFFLPTHQAIFRSMRALEGGGLAIDFLTLAEALTRTNAPEPEFGWTPFLIDLLNIVPTSINIAGYARIVADHAQRRAILRAGEKMATLAYDLDVPNAEILGRATEVVLSMQAGPASGQVIAPREYAREFLDELDNPNELEVIPTPIVALNQLLLGGLSKPFVNIVAARPKVGKSALALQIAGYAAISLGKRVYMATTEMSSRQFTRRVISQQTGIPAAKLKQRNLSPAERERAMVAAGRLSESGPHLDVSAGLTPGQVRARAMRLAARGGLDLMIVDHLHEMAADTPMSQRHLELGAMARSLRDTAKQVDVPLLLVAQLSRSTESRQDKRPQLADLREAGAIEEVAYSVMFLYRESYYDETRQTSGADPTEIIVAAHRDGPTGTVHVAWNGPLMRFDQPSVSAGSNGSEPEKELPAWMERFD